jgi:DtxR family Mn-dependent transcriptional regulator
LIDRLDGYLDYPQFDPHGDPIPDSDGKLPSTSNLLLCDTEVNNTYIITAVRDTTSSFLQQLERFGLQIGKSITTIEVMAYDNSILIEVEEAPSILVSEKIARNLIVSAVAR